MRSLLGEGKIKSFPHLRRCAKPGDLPAHLKTQFMNDTAAGRQAHTGKSTWIYIILAETSDLTFSEIRAALSDIEDVGEEPFITKVLIPSTAPTSQIQAAMWSAQFWPTIYRKNNPLGPHPSQVSRATEEIKPDAHIWMTLAHQVALSAKVAKIGEAMGAVIVQRLRGEVQLLGIAGDARWHQECFPTKTGNPMAHCALRAISMVAQKLVRLERRLTGEECPRPLLEYDAFQDEPLLDEEKTLFTDEHPCPDGYLCHGLELYLTHEPCVQCSMGILHSRMGKVVFAQRMPLTGGMCAEERGHGHPDLDHTEAGQGLGLFWRRELNWSLMAWEWEPNRNTKPLPSVPYQVHA
jgi:tRNA-specific adenosine deaminase 3